MANIKKVVNNLIETLKTNVGNDGLGNKDAIVSYGISNESIDKSMEDVVLRGINNIEQSIDTTISAIISNEEFAGLEFKKNQIDAAKKIAILALDPTKAVNAMRNMKQTISEDIPVVSAEAMGVDDYLEPGELSVENYDGQSINNALYMSIAYNLLASRQDEFAELWFPTIVIDPLISGLSIDVEYTSIYDDFVRKPDGSADLAKFNKKPLVKNMYNPETLNIDRKNKVVPVLRDDYKNVMVPALQRVDKSTGSDIVTAPLVFGRSIGLLNISQTDELLAKGVMDASDTLDRTVNLDKVYYELTYTDGDGNDHTENFYIQTSMLPHSNFTYTTQGNVKELNLAFSSNAININTVLTKTAKGDASEVLASIGGEYNVKLGLVVHGDGNVYAGDVAVYGSSIQMLEVRDADGNVIVEGTDEYNSVKDVFDTIKYVGYELEAYRTNSNLRTRGKTLTSDKFTQIYQVPMRTGFTVLSSVAGFGGDNDSKLTGQINIVGIVMNMRAVQALIEQSERLYNITNGGAVIVEETIGISRHFVNTFYNETEIALDQYVDSLSSKDRLNDIKSALEMHLRDEAYLMYTNSNYFAAFDLLHGKTGIKPTLIIGTNPRIYNYLTKDGLDLGDGFDVEVKFTPNPLIGDKILMSFGIFDDSRNSKVNPLNFGQTIWAPTITTDIPRTVGGSTSREVTNVPRYLHVPNLNIMSVTHVSGIDKVLGKLSVNFKSV